MRVTSDHNDALIACGSIPVTQKTTYADLLRRTEIGYDDLAMLSPPPDLPAAVREQVEIQVKYEGYIRRQKEQVKSAARRDDYPIPEELDFRNIRTMSTESREKLNRVRPVTLGQARRVPGVTPADIAVLTIYLEQNRRSKAQIFCK
jgi:tRNA uridine 5-carboxymethylaminomethyl modification enzyme